MQSGVDKQSMMRRRNDERSHWALDIRTGFENSRAFGTFESSGLHLVNYFQFAIDNSKVAITSWDLSVDSTMKCSTTKNLKIENNVRSYSQDVDSFIYKLLAAAATTHDETED